MKQRQRADLLVQANGLTDVVVALRALRHQHVLLGLAYGVLGLVWLVGYLRHWRWRPREKDLLLLAVGLGLAWLFLAAELAALF